jgi:predicted TIM-barrel fold metal-dependent hydrolase
MWGSDYPHPRNTFPNTQKILDRIFANVPAKAKAKAIGGNMRRLFSLEARIN